jgi:aminoglycoside phosphotransferase (APT) family kinase protein
VSQPQWAPTVVVDEAQARALITNAFPEVSVSKMTYIGAGWDNTAWRANDIVFRFPRRGIARALMQTETTVLPRIAHALPLPISAPTHIGEPSHDYPYPWAGYRWMPGDTGCRCENINARASARSLGEFLRALHHLPQPAPVDGWRGNVPGQVRKLSQTLNGMSPETLPNVDAIRTLASALEHTRMHSGPDVLCHGDLYARHVLFTDGTPSGIIDWGDVHRGDPATDIAAAVMLFEREDHEPFHAAYGPIDRHTWQRARFRALFSGVYQVHYATSVSDVALERAGRAAIRRALIR